MDIANIYLHINDTCNSSHERHRQLQLYERQLQQQLHYYSQYLPKCIYTLNNTNANYYHYLNQLMIERQRQQQQYIKDSLRRQQKMNYYYKHYIAPMHKDINAFGQRVTDDIKALGEESERRRAELPLIEKEIKSHLSNVRDTLQQRNNALMNVTSDVTYEGMEKYADNHTADKIITQMNYPKQQLDDTLQDINKKVSELHDNMYKRREQVQDVTDKCLYETNMKEQ